MEIVLLHENTLIPAKIGKVTWAKALTGFHCFRPSCSWCRAEAYSASSGCSCGVRLPTFAGCHRAIFARHVGHVQEATRIAMDILPRSHHRCCPAGHVRDSAYVIYSFTVFHPLLHRVIHFSVLRLRALSTRHQYTGRNSFAVLPVSTARPSSYFLHVPDLVYKPTTPAMNPSPTDNPIVFTALKYCASHARLRLPPLPTALIAHTLTMVEFEKPPGPSILPQVDPEHTAASKEALLFW